MKPATLVDQTISLSLIEFQEGTAQFLLKINPKSEIFKGHFPDNPVLPGVLSVEAVKKALFLLYSKEWVMDSARDIKFLAVIDPRKTQEILLDLVLQPEENLLKVEGKLFSLSEVFFKIKANYRPL